MLKASRTRARELYLRRRLDEGQYAILERRIDELAGNARMSSIHKGYDFLPHGLAKTLETMLRDGRISAPEQEYFLRMLGADQHMDAKEKRKVKALVQEWFASDLAD